jgi:hypothetical protein
MATEFWKRRAEIMTFLKGLSEREKRVVLLYLCNDASIAPNLASKLAGIRHSCHEPKSIQLAEGSNLDLAFLARRKGCRLERVVGAGDRWRIFIRGHDDGDQLRIARHSQNRSALTLGQALAALRALPDQETSTTP